MRFAALATLLAALLAPQVSSATLACGQPNRWSIAAAFDLAANGLLPASYPQPPAGSGAHTIPPSLLKAIGWVESGWRQYTAQDRPLVSFDFGYGIMQITSGMAGAFGKPAGDLTAAEQSRIASDYVYNIAYGARMLASKWASSPMVGDGDPTVIEDWYYAIWAYNGWGWVNNPNNSRFHRRGTPATNPSDFPYQERVLYLVAHPPRDADGNPLWAPVHVSLPPRKRIARDPGPLSLNTTHQQQPPTLSAVYRPDSLRPAPPRESESVRVRVMNTGTAAWPATGTGAISLAYDLFTEQGDPWKAVSPFSPGIVAFGQGSVPLPHAVMPGRTATFTARIAVPAQAGTYLLVWDMEQGTAGWFSQAGVLPRAERLVVVGGNATVTATATPTPTAEPAEGLHYVADTSIPDGTTVQSRERFTKGWLVFNEGKTAWSSGWTLRHISGPSFGRSSIAVPATNGCRSAIILASLLAPRKPGSYTGSWRLRDPAGRTVGDALTVVVTVTKNAPPPTPTPTPVGAPSPRPTRTPAAPTPTPVG